MLCVEPILQVERFMAKKPLSESFTKAVLTTGDIARYCHTNVFQVNCWIKNEELKTFQTPGGHNRITIEEFKSFLERHNIPVSEEIQQKVTKGRILIADDDTVLANLIKNVMEDRFKNIEIEIAHDGYEALIKTGKFGPDLLILDIRMPKIDGLEVCRRLRHDTTLSPGMKIIAITAHSNKYDRETVLASGADEYLVKPIDMQTLQDHVEKLIYSMKYEV